MNGWVVTLNVTAPTDDKLLHELLEHLAGLHGAVAGNRRGWSATVTLDAPDADTAQGGAAGNVLRYARKAGLPTKPVTRVETVREDIRDAELERPTMPDLVSGPEAAEILGVTRQRIHQLAHEHPDFPTPAYKLGVGSLWFRAGVEAFAQRWDRTPGRRKKRCPDPDCRGELEPWTGHGVGSRKEGDPLPPITKGTLHCATCGTVYPVDGDPWTLVNDDD